MTPPKPETLEKYGLTAEEWIALAEAQGNACAVCRKPPTTGRLCVDHEHTPKYKKLPPEERKKRVRGLLCFFCNKYYVGRAITIEKSRNVTRYLETYATRRGFIRDQAA